MYALEEGIVPEQDIILIYMGNNDLVDGLGPANALAGKVELEVERLLAAGAKYVFVGNLPVRNTPRWQEV